MWNYLYINSSINYYYFYICISKLIEVKNLKTISINELIE